MSSVSEISKALNNYGSKQLLRVYREVLQDFVQRHQDQFSKHGIGPVSQHDRAGITGAMAAIFFYKDLFDSFLAASSEAARKIILSVIWDGRQPIDYLEDKYKTVIVANKSSVKKPEETVLPEYLFLSLHYKSSSSLSDGPLPFYNLELDLAPNIRHHVRIISEPPVPAELMPLPELPPRVAAFETTAFFDEFVTLRTYLEQNRKERLTASTIKKVQKQLDLNEFYPNHRLLGSLRTRLQLQFMRLCLPLKPASVVVHEQIKEAFGRYRQWWYTNLPHLLFHLKGSKTLISEDTSVNKILFETLMDLPYMQWVAADNLVAYIRYRKPELRPFKMYQVRNLLYLERGASKEREYVSEVLYFPQITEPLIKGAFFLYATLGLVDIAYSEPAPDAVSHFDGLAYVRLTPLGAYVCGLNPAYQAPAAVGGAVGFELDEHRLLISITGTSKLNALMLDKYADRTGETLYKVSYESFLTGCETLKQIENKISSFRKEISDELPAFWQDFMNSLQARYNKIGLRNDCRVYKLAPDDNNLIMLVARDEVLKLLVQKAEGYQVLVKDIDAPKFKARLRQFGYLFMD